MAEDGDPNLPLYSELEGDGLLSWIDGMAARADELGLPLTHPRFNKDIVWMKHHDVTVSLVWARGGSIPLTTVTTSQEGESSATKAQSELSKAEAAASILMEQKIIIETFFRLVRMGQTGMVALFVQKGLVSPDVTDGWGYEDGYGRQFVPEKEKKEKKPKKERKVKKGKSGEESLIKAVESAPVAPVVENHGDPWNGATPLLVAVDAGDAAMVRVLVHLGADINRMARPPDLHRHTDAEPRYLHRLHLGQDDELDMRVRRTPLMLAAAQGRIALVRLFFEELKADDSLVAPDGYSALRLAAQGRHREIVALLPSRRGGAWARFSTRHGRAMQRIKKAGKSIVWFTTVVGKLVGWYVPKFLLYDLPRWLVIEPLGRLGRYLKTHWREVLPAIGRFVAKVPRRVWSITRDLGRLVYELTEELIKAIGRLPQALKIAGQWLVATLKTIGSAIANVAGRALSAIHTVLAAVFDFFRTVTLADVARGFNAVLHAIFVGLPQALLTSVKLLGEYSLKAVHAVFGIFASVFYFLGLVIFHIIAFVPRQLWRVLCAVGSSISGAFHEVVVWFDPKSVV